MDPLIALTLTPYSYTPGNPLMFVDPLGLDWLDDTSNWIGGFGDALTFGGTREVRRLISYDIYGEDDDLVDNCSDFYVWGEVGGVVASLITLSVGGGTVATAYSGVSGAMGMANAVSDLREGDYVGATISVFAAVPALGVATTGAARSSASIVNARAPGTIARTSTWWHALEQLVDPAASAFGLVASIQQGGDIFEGV